MMPHEPQGATRLRAYVDSLATLPEADRRSILELAAVLHAESTLEGIAIGMRRAERVVDAFDYEPMPAQSVGTATVRFVNAGPRRPLPVDFDDDE